ncbi:MAG: efflux RND transporter periplasmic adaptor subunit [Sphingomonadaceae bacterium]|nr:efflux RND transporter periplasmic adaptor subunit [Sphingomonadaceae bacterium]
MRKLTFIPTIALALALAACGSDADPEGAGAQQAADPTALAVQEVAVERWTAVSAEVSTVDQAQVLARIPGIVTSLSVKEGDYVQKGQAIGRIVDSQLGYQSGAYGAQAAAAAAQAAQAQAELSRTKYLYENGVYAKARLEQAQAAASAAQAQVRAAQAQQQAVNAVAGQGVLYAPASGRVLMADVPPGSAVAPGMPIAVITSGPVVVKLEMPESLAGKVHAGSEVRVKADNGDVLTGTIQRVYPSVAGGQVRADAQVAGIDTSLIGRRLAAEVASGKDKGLVIPQDYVVTRYGVDYVTIRPKGGKPASMPVQTAPAGEAGKVEILSGVNKGDVIVKPAAPAAGGGKAE